MRRLSLFLGFVFSVAVLGSSSSLHAQRSDVYYPPVLIRTGEGDVSTSSSEPELPREEFSSPSEEPTGVEEVQTSSPTEEEIPENEPSGIPEKDVPFRPLPEVVSSSSSSKSSVTVPPRSSSSAVATTSASSAASSDAPVREIPTKEIIQSSSSSTSSSSSSLSSTSSSSSGAALGIFNPENFRRENFGYTIPIIDTENMAQPEDLPIPMPVVLSNLFYALLFTIVMALSGVILQYLYRTNEAELSRILRRLPFQAVLTALLVWVFRFFLPVASAQGVDWQSSVSMFHIPVLAFTFFMVIGASNYLFDNIISEKGTRANAVVGKAVFGKFFQPDPREVKSQKWLVLLLIVVYGLAGAYINPSFSLIPAAQIGMTVITIAAVLISAYTKDSISYLMARLWKYSPLFRANVFGLFFAITCVLLGRAMELNPGYIYGLPISLFFIRLADEKQEGMLNFFGIAWMLLIATAMWFLAPQMKAYEVLHDFFNIVFVILIEGAFLEMLPLPYLTGGSVYQWKRFAWAGGFTMIVFLLFQTLFNPQSTIMHLAKSPPTLSALMILGCYAAGVFILWGYLMWRRRQN